MKKLEEIISQVRAEMGSDFVSTDIVGLDGISITGSALDPTFKASDTSARFAEVMKLAVKISKKTNIGKVDENLVTTDKNFIVSRFLGDGSYYWAVVVTSNATLGMIRMLMNEFAGQIWDAIPHEDKLDTIISMEEKSKPETPKLETPIVEVPKEQKIEEVKTKKYFWADAEPKVETKGDENSDEISKPAFRFP